MRAGRRPAWRLDAAPDEIVLDAQGIDARGRVSIGFLATPSLPWLSENAELLAVTEPELGRARILPWTATDPVNARLAELTRLLRAGDRSVVPELHRLQDRYRRVRLDPDGRVVLPLAITVHLAVVEGGTIFVASFVDHVELWSVKYRTARLAEGTDDDLP